MFALLLGGGDRDRTRLGIIVKGIQAEQIGHEGLRTRAGHDGVAGLGRQFAGKFKRLGGFFADDLHVVEKKRVGRMSHGLGERNSAGIKQPPQLTGIEGGRFASSEVRTISSRESTIRTVSNQESRVALVTNAYRQFTTRA